MGNGVPPRPGGQDVLEHGAKNLAGKAARFAVSVKAVKAPKPSEIDDALAARFGADSLDALKEQILPLATYVTPNHFEALALSGMESIESVEDLTEAARRIHDTYDVVVLAKGGVVLDGPEGVLDFLRRLAS